MRALCVEEEELPIPQFSEWPMCKSHSLEGIVDAIRARSKSIRFQSSKFDLAVVTETKNGVEFEAINVAIENWLPNPDRLSIAFWDDGVVSLDARRISKTGWEYQFSFLATFTDVEPEALTDMIQKSVGVILRSEMELIWARCKPTGA